MYPFFDHVFGQGKKVLGNEQEPQRFGACGSTVQTIQRTPDLTFAKQ